MIRVHGFDTEIVEPPAELDIATAAEAQRRIVDLTTEERVIVDLSQVHFMDCAGLGALLRARAVLEGEGGTMLVVNPTPEVRRVLHLTHTDDLVADPVDGE